MTQLETLQSALADRYAIEKEIGVGGMATVYLARDIKHSRPVALKVLKPELGAVLGADRFLSEIKVTANLQHPNLLPLFDSGEANGLLFYVMPFVTGESLRARLDRERQLSIEEAVRIGVACASALAYAHEHGVIHRDLKPENILLQSGQPVIADFGIALAVTNAGGTRVTQTGLSLGTPQYMSPEQATGDRVIDARSDIYSLGAVTYEMLSGEPPHSGASAQAIIAKLMTSEPQPLNTLRTTIPVNVACAVEKALAKLPADRFSSANDFAQALTNPHFTIASKAGRASADQTAAIHKWKRFAISSTVFGALLLAALSWLVFRPAPPKRVVRYALDFDSTEAPGGSLARLALSPDGSRFVYTNSPGPRLMLRERNQLHGTPLPGADAAYSPFFSNDGTKVGYLTPPATIKIVSLTGGPPIEISDSASAPGAYGPDGSIYFTHLREHTIVRTTEGSGGKLQHLTRLDSVSGENNHYWPDPLPNGKGLLFTIGYSARASNKTPAIAVYNFSTGKYRVIATGVRARYADGQILYATRDGSLMSAAFDQDQMNIIGTPIAVTSGIRLGGLDACDFALANDGTLVYATGGTGLMREAIWVDRSGRIEQVDPAWKGEFASPAISPDGKRLAMSIANTSTTDIWVKQLDRGPALKLTFEGTVNQYPVWTPDGRSITYDGNVSGQQEIWTKRADGSAQAVLQVHLNRELAEPLWSRDAKWLIVRSSVSSGPGAGDILALRSGIDSVPTPLLYTNFAEAEPALSPDGRWMVYRSNESGRNEIYVVPFPIVAAAKWPISTQGGTEPMWSHSGRELFYRTADNNLVSVAITPGPTFSAGETKVLFSVRDFVANNNHRQYDISGDDKRFIFVRAIGGAGQDKLVFVENWLEELRKQSGK